ncbi:hypothetical protein [Bacillus sp. RO1]|uniref:hypothetical protein n=1 Tax=Bacillus sp. RO1 TaxID=2722703 RepID=UPI0014570197|nr:hypothetical protein [Bacillus sp. RO1]NLP52484.1 hypothetical protein [Bacillus sp. RO1]
MKIIPYLSVGPLKINMKKDEIQKVIKEEPKAFMTDEDEPAEHYVNAGLLVYYSEDGLTSNAFEFVGKSNPEINGICFLEMTEEKALETLRELDRSVIEVADTHISKKLGISLYMLNDRVESILVFENGYYDEMFELLAELDNEI